MAGQEWGNKDSGVSERFKKLCISENITSLDQNKLWTNTF